MTMNSQKFDAVIKLIEESVETELTLTEILNTEQTKRIAESLTKNTSLHTLILNGNNLGDDGVQELSKALKNNTTLRHITLGNNKIRAPGVIALTEMLKTNTSLQSLDLHDNEIGKAVSTLAETLETNANLQVLNLSFNLIESESAKALANMLKNNKTLRVLDLSHNKVGSCLNCNKSRQNANSSVAGNKIGSPVHIINHLSDKGAEALATALKLNTTLKVIHLNRNAFGYLGVSKFLDILENNSSLEHIDLTGNHTSEALLNRLSLKNNSTLQGLMLTIDDKYSLDNICSPSGQAIQQVLIRNRAMAKEREASKRRALEQSVQQVASKNQSLSNLLPAISNPEMLHQTVQSGNIAALELLLSFSPAPTSKAISEPEPLFVCSLQNSPADYKESKEGDELKRAAEGVNQLRKNLSSSAPTRDLECMSLIHLEKELSQEQREKLKKLGAIFTLGEFEATVLTQLSSRSSAKTSRYLKQLHSDITHIISHWQKGTLNNTSASQALDQHALKLLQEALWSSGATGIEPCFNENLRDLINKALRPKREEEYALWKNQQLSPQAEAAFEQFLIEELWNGWKLNSEEGNPLPALFKTYETILLCQRIQKGEISAEHFNRVKQGLQSKLTELIPQNFDEKHAFFAISQACKKEVSVLLENHKKQNPSSILEEASPVYAQSIDNILNKWYEKLLSEDEIKSLSQVIKQIPPGEFLKGPLHEEISKQAVNALITDCKPFLHPSYIEKKEDIEQITTVKNYLEERLRIISNRYMKESYKPIICESLLMAWKQNQSTPQEQELEKIILQKWNDYLERCHKRLNPEIEIGALKAKLADSQKLIRQFNEWEDDKHALMTRISDLEARLNQSAKNFETKPEDKEGSEPGAPMLFSALRSSSPISSLSASLLNHSNAAVSSLPSGNTQETPSDADEESLVLLSESYVMINPEKPSGLP